MLHVKSKLFVCFAEFARTLQHTATHYNTLQHSAIIRMVCAGNGIESVGGCAVAAALVSANTVLQVQCSVQQLCWRVLQMC